MDKPYADVVAEKALSHMESIATEVDKLIGDQPFGSRKVSGRHAVEVFRSLTPDELGLLFQEFGKDAVDAAMVEVAKTERRLKS